MFAPDAQSYLNATTFHFLFNSALHIQMGEIVRKLAQNHIFSPNSGDLMQGHSHILPKDCKTAPSPRRSVATAGNASRAALSIDTAQEHKGSETQRCSSIRPPPERPRPGRPAPPREAAPCTAPALLRSTPNLVSSPRTLGTPKLSSLPKQQHQCGGGE
jgi:hypothetical protein